MSRSLLYSLAITMLVSTSASAQFASMGLQNKKKQKSPFEEHIDFEGMAKRYLMKETPKMERLEGIYSVSAIITKRGGFLSSPNREKVMLRKDNYAKVVILKDTENKDREYIEISLDSKLPDNYPVVGEFTSLSEGEAFVYKHYEPKSDEKVSYSFVSSEFGILDGILVKTVKRKTVTYKLSYLKIYPKGGELLTRELLNNR